MSLKANAEQLWTRLLSAMREDGMIAHCVTQTGPATTQVLVETVQQAMRPWIPMHMKPTPGKQVVALKHDGSLEVICFCSESGKVKSWDDRYGQIICLDEDVSAHFKAYTFVDTKGVP